jgi:hypothetical protein
MSFLNTRPRTVHAANGGKSMADMFGTSSVTSHFHAGTPARSGGIASRNIVSTLWGNGSLSITRRDSNFLV